MCRSQNNGIDWTPPEETQIAGIYPSIIKLQSGQFVLTCGKRDAKVGRTTSIFTSSNGINWKYRGHPSYSHARADGWPLNTATGGAQAMIAIQTNTVYIVFYAHNPKLPGLNKTYIDGCLFDLSN